jgi:hypothetical protein
VLDNLTVAALSLFAQVPDPGAGRKPPGADKFLTVLQWCAWVASGCVVVGSASALVGALV